MKKDNQMVIDGPHMWQKACLKMRSHPQPTISSEKMMIDMIKHWILMDFWGTMGYHTPREKKTTCQLHAPGPAWPSPSRRHEASATGRATGGGASRGTQQHVPRVRAGQPGYEAFFSGY